MRPLGDVCRRAALPVVCALSLAALGGCASTAPRFRSADAKGGGASPGMAARNPRSGEAYVPPAVRQRPWEEEPLPPALKRDNLLLEIVSLLGVPYEYGGADRTGMDCSAFTEAVYGTALHLGLPRSTADQYKEGTDVPRERLRFGDLVFFNTTGESPSHVGIYVEDDLFAHASVSYGVTISSMENSYYRDRFVGARRIVQ
jgi:cell wall-associated NlpC family hydrolase